MVFRIPTLRSARPAREFQVATCRAQRRNSHRRYGLLLHCGLAAGVLSCVGRAPLALEPLKPGPAPSFASRLAGIDVAHVDLYGGTHGSYSTQSLGVAKIEGSIEAIQPEIDSGAPSPIERGYSLGGQPVRLSFEYGRPRFTDEGVMSDSKRVTVEISWIEPPTEGSSWAAFELLSALNPDDSATVWVHSRGSAGSPLAAAAPERLGLAPMLLHAQRVEELSSAAAADALAAIPAGAPFAEGRAEPKSELALEAFLEFCEAELLVRRGSGALPSLVAPADTWFGGALKLKAGPEGDALRSLAAMMHHLFLEALPTDLGWDAADAARLHEPSVTDEWAVPRLVLMRQMIGALEFRSLLRIFLEEHRGGPAVGWQEFAVTAEETAPGFGARFVRSWLRNKREPKVKTRWTFDAARGRVLLRVDQVHELQGGAAAPAFPFLVSVRLTSATGEVVDHLLEVDKRRDLLEMPALEAPAQLDIDPDGALSALMSIQSVETESTLIRLGPSDH